MWIYINYPNPHITIHGDRTCPHIKKQDRSNRRQRKVTDSQLAAFTDDLRNRRIPFAAKSGLNDIWISLELDSTEEAMKVVLEMKDHLGQRYRPLSRAKITVHCGGPDFERQAAEALRPGYADGYSQDGSNYNQRDRSSKDPGFNGSTNQGYCNRSQPPEDATTGRST